jgi:hypothetical protein
MTRRTMKLRRTIQCIQKTFSKVEQRTQQCGTGANLLHAEVVLFLHHFFFEMGYCIFR